jgi:hypothetical protein
MDPVLRVMELEPEARATKGIRQDQVRTGIKELAMQAFDTGRVFNVPEFGRVAGFKPEGEIIRPRGTIGNQDPALIQQSLKISHQAFLRVGRVGRRLRPVLSALRSCSTLISASWSSGESLCHEAISSRVR